MKEKKKTMISVMLVAILVITLLVGCSSKEPAAEEVKEQQVSNEDVYTVTMTYMTGGTEPEDLKKIEEKLSEMTMEKINCKVELVPVAMADQATKYNMWFANGNKMDIMITVFQDYVSMINSGAFIEMDELIQEYGKDIVAKDEELNFLKAGMFRDKQYGIPTIPAAPGNGVSLYIRKDVYDQLDLSGINVDGTLDYEELDNIYSQIYEKCPEYTTIGYSGNVTLSNYIGVIDNLGVAGYSAGALMDPMNDTTVENLFATDEYYEFLTWTRKWFQDGYISKDASTSTETATTLFDAGRIASQVQMSTPGTRENMELSSGLEVVQLDIGPSLMTTNVYTGVMFFIPKNSQNQEKAMEFLNILFTDADIMNLLTHGIEGEHYTVQDNGLVVDRTENWERYKNAAGVWGDQGEQYLSAPQTPDMVEERQAYFQVSLDHTSKAFGYQFDVSEVSTEQSTVTSVLSKYLTQLEYGTVDLDTVYPEFLKALETAGISDIIEKNQIQLDDWLVNQN